MNYAPVFTVLLGSLDEAARGLIARKLMDALPATIAEQKAWFDPYLQEIDRRTHRHYQGMAQNLKNTYVAHHEKSLTDKEQAEKGLRLWIQALTDLHRISGA